MIGIDGELPSWVAASILRNQDFDLLAIHLYIDLGLYGLNPSHYPSALQKTDLERIEKFCASLDIPLKCIDVTGEVLAKIEDPQFLAILSGRRFPAEALWNSEILFPHLEAAAKSRGAESIATGHLAQLAPELLRFPDQEYDQSHLLADLSRETLKKLVLPLGDVSLDMMLRLAHELRPEISKTGNPADYFKTAAMKNARWSWTPSLLENPEVQARAGETFFRRGPIQGAGEFASGEHRGIPFYAVGTRLDEDGEQYVLASDPATATLTVGARESLAIHGVFVRDLNWSGERPASAHRMQRIRVQKTGPIQTDLGAIDVDADLLEFPAGVASIEFKASLLGLTVGDRLVFYQESRVLGSAMIATLLRGAVAEKAIENE